MLVLSRKKNQSIVIDGGIEIQILQLKGGTVKIGISAPDSVRIVRGELDLFGDMVSVEEPTSSSEAGLEASRTEPGSADLLQPQRFPASELPIGGRFAAK